MTRPIPRRRDVNGDAPLSPGLHENRLLPVLAHLSSDVLATLARGGDPCQRAPAFADLAAAGLSAADCLALLAEGLLVVLPVRSDDSRRAHRSASAKMRGDAATKPPSSKRRAQVAAGKPPRLSHATRLLLTDAGLDWVTKHAQSSRASIESSSSPSVSPCRSAVLPHYDIDLRELSVAGVVILRLPVQARNLAAALTALEISGWKSRVAKPLNGCRGGNDRHHVVIAAYKLHHRQSLIAFHADDGGLRWNWRSADFLPRSDLQNGWQTCAPRWER